MLEKDLNLLLANTFCFAAKVQDFHWNVKGVYFKELHELFGDIYAFAQSSIDTVAELIRTLDKEVDGRISTFVNNSTIAEESNVDEAIAMVKAIINDNQILLASQLTAYKSAEDAGEIGVSNVIQDLITQHQKFEWFLKATANT